MNKKKRKLSVHKIKAKHAEHVAALRGYGWMAVKPVTRKRSK